MTDPFAEIALIVVLATILGMAARALKQPAILGYIAAGLIAGPFGLLKLNNPDTLDAFSQIGITFLLFLVGLEMRLSEIKNVGKAAFWTGLGQIVFTAVVGFGLSWVLGYGTLTSLYLAVILTFSSTIIAIKLLSEKHDLESLYGKIVVGFLLIQDFVALGLLVMLSSISGTEVSSLGDLPWGSVGFSFLKAGLLLIIVLAIGRFLMPKLLHLVGRSPELLLLTSLAWGLGMAALAAHPSVGLNIEIGAFIAGVAMAGKLEHAQISSRVKSLRDFFLVMFFVVLGSKMALGHLAAIWVPAILLSLFVLIGKPLIVMLIMGGLGYRSRTSFLASVTVAQISEFSLIIAALGLHLGHLDEQTVSLVTLVALITITLSSYLILNADTLYRWFRKPLKSFELRRAKREDAPMDTGHESTVVLIGCHRMGHNILQSLQDMHKKFVVIDFNPEVVERLQKRGIHAVYGDVSDPDIQELARLDSARLVISTIPDANDSFNILQHVRAVNPSAQVILTANDEADAIRLYDEGADYVLLPHFIGGLQLARTIQEDATLESLARMKQQDLAVMIHHP